MTKFLAVTFAASCLASAGLAQTSDFEGLWAQNPASCNATNTDLVPMRISGSTIQFYESRCEMTAPVNIRGMYGQLFDFVCAGEGETWSTRGLLVLNGDDTLTEISNDSTTIFQRCR